MRWLCTSPGPFITWCVTVICVQHINTCLEELKRPSIGVRRREELEGLIKSREEVIREYQARSNDELDKDLSGIANLMSDWEEEKLCTHLGLTQEDIHDIMAKHSSPSLQR